MHTTILAFTEAAPVDDASGFPIGAVLMSAIAIGFVVGAIYLLRSKQTRDQLSWRAAYGWAFVIFIFFMLATTWFPSWLISQQAVATAPSWVSDVVGSAAWFVPLVLGLFGLRWLQKADRI